MKNTMVAAACLALTFFPIVPASADIGDTECTVFIQSASNVVTGGWGNHYRLTLAVRKSLIDQDDGQERSLGVYYKTHWSSLLDKHVLADLRKKKDAGNYYTFTIQLPEGAGHASATAEFSAYFQSGDQTLWDNNVGGPYVTLRLDSGNNWMFVSPNCSTK